MLGPSLNTVHCFSFHHALPKYLQEDIESVQKRAFLIISPECSYEDNLSRFNLFSLGSRREAACSKLFQLMNDLRIQSHQLHHLVHQRHQPTHLRQPFHLPIVLSNPFYLLTNFRWIKYVFLVLYVNVLEGFYLNREIGSRILHTIMH